MGVVKRIQGWRMSAWPIPNTLQVLVGLIEPRDPEAYLEGKRADREAARERAAIQEEGNANRRFVDEMRRSLVQTGRRSENQHLYDLVVDAPDLGTELPVRAAAGWYRYGRTFYRLGSGPFPDFGRSQPAAADIPAARQAMLF